MPSKTPNFLGPNTAFKDMQTVNTVADLRKAVKAWRECNEQVGFVPTMGNLHAGHLKLVETAKTTADRTAVSIFVNPSQFGVGEDFETYPRTEREDSQKLLAAGVDLLFLPSTQEMYDDGSKTVVSVKKLADLHCGRSRPGHFDGVATVVCKLFNQVQPDIAYFGQKDFQQLAIIKTMVRDLDIPVAIQSVETVRESSGLALSSRNGYLSADELAIAPRLYRTLCQARDAIKVGNKSLQQIEQEAIESLHVGGFQPDYFSICRSVDLQKADSNDHELVVLAAAKLGSTRLIDNICFSK